MVLWWLLLFCCVLVQLHSSIPQCNIGVLNLHFMLCQFRMIHVVMVSNLKFNVMVPRLWHERWGTFLIWMAEVWSCMSLWQEAIGLRPVGGMGFKQRPMQAMKQSFPGIALSEYWVAQGLNWNAVPVNLIQFLIFSSVFVAKHIFSRRWQVWSVTPVLCSLHHKFAHSVTVENSFLCFVA